MEGFSCSLLNQLSGNEIFQGAADTFEDCDFVRIGAAGTLAAYEFVQIGDDVRCRDEAFSHR